MKSIMHIGFVALDYPSSVSGGGVGNQVRTLAQALVQAGHRVTVVALSEPGLPAYDDDGGIRIYRVARGNLHWYASKLPGLGSRLILALRELEYGWAAYRQIQALRRQEPFDLIEGTETGAFWIAICLRDVPLVIRLHGEMYTFHKYTPDLPMTLALRLNRVLQRVALRRARLLISPSHVHAQEIAAELGAEHPAIEVIPNTLALPLQSDGIAATDSTAAIPRGPFILYVGRLERRKGIPLLFEAAHQLIQAMPEVRFVLAGGHHPTLSQADLERLVQRFGLRDHIHFLGHVPKEQLSIWYRRAAMCVLPSYYETFGLAALEPMAFGVPVVTTTAGGLPEVVEDGVTGILVAPGDAPALAEAMLRLLRDTDLRSRIGRAGRERAERRFDVAQHLDTTLQVFRASMNTKSPAVGGDAEHIFFSPHFDDVVLSCGGLIASLLKQGKSVRVVTVFAGNDEHASYSAYARHLHAKWETEQPAHVQRLQEDLAALRDLGVRQIEQWNFLEAPYRLNAAGQPLYASYEELQGNLATEDRQTGAALSATVLNWLGCGTAGRTLYFPLSLGRHVDHQLLFHIGMRLRATSYRVRFYEEWPYVESYALSPATVGWSSQVFDILLDPKIRAARQYTSQIQGLGGSAESLTRRLTQFSRQIDGGQPKERYWEVSQQTALWMTELPGDGALPFTRQVREPALSDFGGFLDSLRWHNVDEVLPIGAGDCLDLGCGSGRQRSIIQQRGYRWIGVDRTPGTVAGPVLQADCQRLPFGAHRAAAVVAWQVLEYVEQPEHLFAEVARVIEPGGIFCGSVSFLEPVHGRTFYGTSPLLIEYLLRKYGFTDIQIRPGLSGFALMLWTWLRRLGGPALGRLALPLAAAWLAPLAAMRFLVSWLWWYLGYGTGHGMRWIVELAPLEFAGHVMFTARKAGRSSGCISDS